MIKSAVLKRILQMIPVLIGVSFLTFMLIYLAPGDAVRTMYAASGNIPNEAELNERREELGLNDPLLVQYGRWLSKAARGDLGRSYSMSKDVSVLISSRILPTVKLTLLSLALMLIIAIPLGLLSAVYKDTLIDYLIRGVTFFGISMPNFWVGLLLLYFISLQLKLLPVVASGTGFKKMILPALTLAIAMASKYARQLRAIVLEEINQDYVLGARARGESESAILWKHIFPNVLLPLITLLGLSLGSLLGGTAVVEIIFSYQGLGSFAIQAISAYDYNLIQAYVLLVAIIYMCVNLIVDLLYAKIDPRIRLKN